jgi:peptide/nickel transport system substrate-binding protein
MSNTFDPTVGVQRLYWSKNFKRGVPFSNGSGYNNPEVDRLLEAASVETDPTKRLEEFVQFQRIVARELPDINLIGLQQVTIYNKRVHGHTVTADGLNGNLADLSVER